MAVSYLDTVGDTPLVEVSRVLPDAVRAQGTKVLCKMEMQNPGGSVKVQTEPQDMDRIAKAMIERAEAEGKLKPGGTVVEYTSGNTGIGLSMICAAKGYRCIIIMPQLPPFLERYTICRQFGSEVHLTAPGKGFPGLKEYAEALLKENPDYFCTNQFENEANPEIHYRTTGPEILKQAGSFDYFVAGIGTAGTITGAGKFFKEQNPDMKIIAVEPSESRVHVGATHSPHTILGIGPGIPLPFVKRLDPNAPLEEGPRGIISEFKHASSAEAIHWAKELARKEGMMVGPSSGAAFKVAVEIASQPEAAGKTVVVLLASHGIRYCAHPLWNEVKDEAMKALPCPPCMDKTAPTLLWRSDEERK